MRRRRWEAAAARWCGPQRLYLVGDITVSLPRRWLFGTRRLVRVRITTGDEVREVTAWVERGQGRPARP